LGDFIYCVPAQQKLGSDWYRGTADAVRQNLDLIGNKEVDYVVVLSGDHIYKMNYSQMVAYHKKKNADLTTSAIRVRKGEAAGRLGVLEADHDYKIVGFEEKPEHPKTIFDAPEYALASMGVYVFKVSALKRILEGEGDDFGKDVIPALIGRDSHVFVYDYEKENRIEDFIVEVEDGKRNKVLAHETRDSSYWKDVGTIDSYYEASMDLVCVAPQFNLYGEKWPMRACQRPLPPSKCILGGNTLDSMVSDGCIISGGTVTGSILGPGVVVEKGAVVERSIVFDDVRIEPGARVKRTIIDKEARIRAGATIGFDAQADRNRGCTISDGGIVVVPKAANIG